MFLQQTQIVIRAVHEQFVTAQRFEQRHEIDVRQRIHEFVARHGADLDQADFFGIRVQTIRFRVHGDPDGRAQRFQKARELLFRVNHA